MIMLYRRVDGASGCKLLSDDSWHYADRMEANNCLYAMADSPKLLKLKSRMFDRIYGSGP